MIRVENPTANTAPRIGNSTPNIYIFISTLPLKAAVWQPKARKINCFGRRTFYFIYLDAWLFIKIL